jgi:hypothetical protein
MQASGARPLSFWASAISTDQPSCSSVSWTSLAPVIDSTTAQTGSRWTSSIRRASLLSDSASGGVASWSRYSPSSLRRQTSTLRRLRSNPACNIEVGPPLRSLLGDSRSVSPEGALLHGSPKRNLCSGGTASDTAACRARRKLPIGQFARGATRAARPRHGPRLRSR